MRTSRTDFQVINDDVCRRSWSTSGLSQSVWHICMVGYCHSSTMNAFNNQRIRLVLSIVTVGATKIVGQFRKRNGNSKSNCMYYIRATNLGEINEKTLNDISRSYSNLWHSSFKDTTEYSFMVHSASQPITKLCKRAMKSLNFKVLREPFDHFIMLCISYT